MRTRDNFWMRRLNSNQLSRRRFIGTTGAAGAGAAGLALVGCGGDDDDDGNGGDPTAAPTSGNGGDPTPTEGSGGTGGDGSPTQGGIARFSSSNNTWDTFDIDRSRFSPFAVLMGYTNQGIVHYSSFGDAILEGGFSESWETPDDTTLTFTLRDGLTWQNKPPVDGRAATVEDMAHFIDRNRMGVLQDGTEDVNFYRKASYDTVESVEVVDDSTLRVTFTQPNPFFLSTLAGSYAKVQAPEAVAAFENRYADLSADLIIGTGPFVLTEFDPEGSLTLLRNEDFFEPAWWDGLEYVPLFTDNAAQQAAFEQKQIDSFAPTSNSVLADILERYEGDVYNSPTLAANPQAGTYYGGAPPWNDERLIGAIFRAIDRHAYIAQIIEGRGSVSSNIPPAQAAFGIPERELITFPGYKPPELREEDVAEALQMWQAAEGNSLGQIIVDIPDIYEGAYSGVSEFLLNLLNTTLQTDQFVAEIQPYATISSKIVAQEYGNGRNNVWWGWISDLQSLEPTDGLYRVYNSTAPQFFQYGVTIPRVDELTAQGIVEPDVEVRKTICQDVVRELVSHNGAGIPHTLLQFSNVLRWNYYHTGEQPAFINAHNTYRQSWFDINDPTYQDRPS